MKFIKKLFGNNNTITEKEQIHNDDEQFYPDWVYRRVIENNLPWDKKSDHNIETFLDTYTLHDSSWIGIFYDIKFDQSVTLGFQWDSVWLPDNIKEGTSHVDDWPYLFIKIDSVKEISTNNFEELYYELNRTIRRAEITKIEEMYYLTIDDVYGGQVNIVFSGDHYILALNPDCSKLKI
jgi:hypothetical protein